MISVTHFYLPWRRRRYFPPKLWYILYASGVLQCHNPMVYCAVTNVSSQNALTLAPEDGSGMLTRNVDIRLGYCTMSQSMRHSMKVNDADSSAGTSCCIAAVSWLMWSSLSFGTIQGSRGTAGWAAAAVTCDCAGCRLGCIYIRVYIEGCQTLEILGKPFWKSEETRLYFQIWYDMLYLLTVIGLTAGGSSTVHIYTQTVHRTTQWNNIPWTEHT
jgi:hypothetical protein